MDREKILCGTDLKQVPARHPVQDAILYPFKEISRHASHDFSCPVDAGGSSCPDAGRFIISNNKKIDICLKK